MLFFGVRNANPTSGAIEDESCGKGGGEGGGGLEQGQGSRSKQGRQRQKMMGCSYMTSRAQKKPTGNINNNEMLYNLMGLMFTI